MKLSNFIISIIAIAAALVVANCSDEPADLFENTYKIEKLRIIGVRSDPPELRFDNGAPSTGPFKLYGIPISLEDLATFGFEPTGALSKLRVLAVDPLHLPYTALWVGQSAGVSDVQEQIAGALYMGSPLIPIGAETLVDFSLQADHEGEEAYVENHQTLVSTLDAGFGVRPALKSVFLTVGEQQANRNPKVSGIVFEQESPFFKNNQKIKATCRYSDPDPEDAARPPRVNWYIELGDLESSIKDSTVWRSGKRRVGPATIRCVVRDLRGGANWFARDVFLGDPARFDLAKYPPAGTDAIEGDSVFWVETKGPEGMFILPIEVHDQATAETLRNNIGGGDPIWIGGIISPDHLQRYNFHFMPETVSASTAIPPSVSNPDSLFTAFPQAITDEVPTIENASNLSMMMGILMDGDLPLSIPAGGGEDDDAPDIEKAFEAFNLIMSLYFGAEHYLQARVLLEHPAKAPAFNPDMVVEKTGYAEWKKKFSSR